MKKIAIFENGDRLVHNGIYIYGGADLPIEELDISDEEFIKAKKDKKYMDKLTKEKKDIKVKVNSLSYKNGTK